MPRRGDRVLVQRVETVPPARHPPSHGSLSSLPPPPVPVRSRSKAAAASASQPVSVPLALARALPASTAAVHFVLSSLLFLSRNKRDTSFSPPLPATHYY